MPSLNPTTRTRNSSGQKIWISSLLAVFLKHGQVDLPKASNSISVYLALRFSENWFFGFPDNFWISSYRLIRDDYAGSDDDSDDEDVELDWWRCQW